MRLIDADALPKYTGYALSANEVAKAVENAPTIEAEPVRRGRWIEKEGYNGDTYYDCSICLESWSMIEGTPWDNGMAYCPHCGARMEAEE